MLIETEIEPIGDSGELYRLKIFDGGNCFDINSKLFSATFTMSTNELLQLRAKINQVVGYAVRED